MEQIIMMSTANIQKYTAIVKGLLADNETAIANLKTDVETNYVSDNDFETSPIDFSKI